LQDLITIKHSQPNRLLVRRSPSNPLLAFDLPSQKPNKIFGIISSNTQSTPSQKDQWDCSNTQDESVGIFLQSDRSDEQDECGQIQGKTKGRGLLERVA